jgi:hypothetical protein
MKKLFITSLAVASATLSACSEAPITAAPDGFEGAMSNLVTVQATIQVCSAQAAGNGGFVTIAKNPNWANPVDPDGAGPGVGTYVGPSPTSNVNYTPGPVNPTSYGTYVSTFTLPAGATGVSISGNVLVDNDVTLNVNGNATFFGTFPGGGNPGAFLYPANAPDNRTLPNFQTAGGLAFGTNAGFVGGNNTVNFVVFNDNNPNTANVPANTNPTGLSFCYTVTYTPAQVGDRGCSPGYWKNHLFPNGFSKGQLFNSDIPGTNFANAFPGMTFQEVLEQGGGGLAALGRHTVSAYFNAVVYGAAYGMTPAQVVAAFNAAYASGDATQISDLAALFASMEDVGNRICDNPTGKPPKNR